MGPGRTGMRSWVMSRLKCCRFRQSPKTLPHPLGLQVGHVEVDVRMPGALHLADNRRADHVARGQFRAGVVVGHEAVAVAVHQMGPFAAHRFGDQVAAAAGDVEHRGMELDELHVAQLGAGPIGHGHAVAGGHFGIGRFPVDLPQTAGAEDGCWPRSAFCRGGCSRPARRGTCRRGSTDRG